MILNDAAHLVPFAQRRSQLLPYPRDLALGAVNGLTAFDLALAAPPTARRLMGYAAATNGSTSSYRFLMTAATRLSSSCRAAGMALLGIRSGRQASSRARKDHALRR